MRDSCLCALRVFVTRDYSIYCMCFNCVLTPDCLLCAVCDVMSDSGSCVLREVTLCSPVGEILLSGCEIGVHTINIKLGTDKDER